MAKGYAWIYSDEALTYNAALEAAARRGGALTTVANGDADGFWNLIGHYGLAVYRPDENGVDPALFAWVSSPTGFTNNQNGVDYRLPETSWEDFKNFGTKGFNEGPLAHAYAVEFASSRITGTQGGDVLAATASGVTLDGLAGADLLIGSSWADVLLGGAGDDFLFGRGGADLLKDGDGADFVYGGASATIQAAMDGDNDYYEAGKIDYSAASQNIAIDGYTAHGAEIGTDEIGSPGASVYTGAGDDNIYWEGWGLVNGGAGSDTITGGLPGARGVTIEGGAGNDSIFLLKTGGKANGGPGEDKLYAVSQQEDFAHELTGGAGADEFYFNGYLRTSEYRQIIWDMQASGAVQDTIFFESMTNGGEMTGVEAMARGYLNVREAGGYTYLEIDRTGGGDNFQMSFTLKGTFGTELYDDIVFRF